jgi:hypothetical protein
MTSVGWIDFSSEHRDKVRKVIDLLKQAGVVDELGIGVIRDSFADRMFPGISTIQTRAKYFTLTALLIHDYEEKSEKQKRKQSLEQYMTKWEKWCRVELAKRYGNEGEARGIIGITFGQRSDRDVQRPPSSVYWNGLREFGILRTQLSLAEFNREISGRRSLKAVLEGTDRLKGDDRDADANNGFRARVPEMEDDYWNTLSITLTRHEAEFLRTQMTASVPKSLLGQILRDEKTMRDVTKLGRNAPFADLADLPFIQRMKNDELRKTVSHARDFWAILEGAHIRYNCLLRKRFGPEQEDDTLNDEWDAWQKRMREFDWSAWDSAFMWLLVEEHGSNVRTLTRRFVNEWIKQAHAGAVELDVCDQLVIAQEMANKKGRARLRPGAKVNGVAEWIGLSELNYRLPQVRTIVEDIYRGETGKADADAGR